MVELPWMVVAGSGCYPYFKRPCHSEVVGILLGLLSEWLMAFAIGAFIYGILGYGAAVIVAWVVFVLA